MQSWLIIKPDAAKDVIIMVISDPVFLSDSLLGASVVIVGNLKRG